jgi:hypothetical protein
VLTTTVLGTGCGLAKRPSEVCLNQHRSRELGKRDASLKAGVGWKA